jgi:hypothetical protein
MHSFMPGTSRLWVAYHNHKMITFSCDMIWFKVRKSDDTCLILLALICPAFSGCTDVSSATYLAQAIDEEKVCYLYSLSSSKIKQ